MHTLRKEKTPATLLTAARTESQYRSRATCFIVLLPQTMLTFLPLFCLTAAVLDGVERLTAEEMDERRQQNMAYEYLCHLEEAKR